MPSEKLQTLVIYDIVADKIRLKVSNICLDYGLERIQYSCFRGALNRNRREALAAEIMDIIEEDDNALIQPLCKTCFDNRYQLGEDD